MAIKITITNAGSGISSLLDIYSGDGITYSMYINNVNKTDLLNGYTFAPALGATKYKVMDQSCGSFVEFTCSAVTTTTTTGGPTTTTTTIPGSTTTTTTTSTTSGPTTTTTLPPGYTTTTTTILTTTSTTLAGTTTTTTTTGGPTTTTTTCAAIYEYSYYSVSRLSKALACADIDTITLWAYAPIGVGVILYYYNTNCVLSTPANGSGLGQYKKIVYDGLGYAIELDSNGEILSTTLCSSLPTTSTTSTTSATPTTTTTTTMLLWHVVNVQRSNSISSLCASSGSEVVDIYSQTFNDSLYSGHVFYNLSGTLYTGSGYYANPQGSNCIYGTITSGHFTQTGSCGTTTTTTLAGTTTTTTTLAGTTTTTTTIPTTTTTTTYASTCQTVNLKFSSLSSASACATVSTASYMVNNADWLLATKIYYGGTNCSVTAGQGYYSNGTVYRYWDGSSVFSTASNCILTTTTTTTTLCVPIGLGYSTLGGQQACISSHSQFSINGSNLLTATKIYQYLNCGVNADNGYYSDDSYYRYWNGTSLGSATACATVTTTTTTIWYTKMHQCGMPLVQGSYFNTTSIPHSSGVYIWTDGVYHYTWVEQSTTSYYDPPYILNKTVTSTIYSTCPAPATTTTSTSTTPCFAVSLGYNVSSFATACAASQSTYYTNNANWLSATMIYSIIGCDTNALAGYYSRLGKYRYWNGTSFTTTGNC